jgi:hypothetical protein
MNRAMCRYEGIRTAARLRPVAVAVYNEALERQSGRFVHGECLVRIPRDLSKGGQNSPL